MPTTKSLRSLIAEAQDLLECNCKRPRQFKPATDEEDADDEMDLGGTNKRGDPTAIRSSTALTPCPSGQVRIAGGGGCKALGGASWKTPYKPQPR